MSIMPSATYMLERDIQDHMQKRVLIGTDSGPIRRSGPLAQHYAAEYRNNRGRVTDLDSWEHMEYDAWIRRFHNLVVGDGNRIHRIR